MCLPKAKTPGPTPLPPPPPPPPQPTPMSPVIDPATKDRLLMRPRSRGLRDLMVTSNGTTGLNIPQ